MVLLNHTHLTPSDTHSKLLPLSGVYWEEPPSYGARNKVDVSSRKLSGPESQRSFQIWLSWEGLAVHLLHTKDSEALRSPSCRTGGIIEPILQV